MNRADHLPDPLLCPALEDALQKLLDGETSALGPELAAHRRDCSECRANFQAAGLLQRGLRDWPRPLPPEGLTDRVIACVLRDRPAPAGLTRLRVQRVLWLAVAASVLLACLGVWLFSANGPARQLIASRFGTPAPAPPNLGALIKDNPENVLPALSLRDSLEEAGSAVAALARRTADETVEPTRKLFVGQVEAPSLSVVEDLPKAIDPAAQSLDEVRQGAAAGLQPVANSARRAFSLLLRDVPPMDGDRKSDS